MVSLSLHLEIYSSRHQYVRDSFLKTLLTCIQDWPVLFGKTILRFQSDINIFSGITVITFGDLFQSPSGITIITFGDLFQSPSVGQRFFFEDTTDLYTRLAGSLGKTIFGLQSDINTFSGITVIAFGDLIQSPSVCQRFFFEDTTDLYTRLASSLWQDHFKIAQHI